ncbi:hypothetical protein DPEC_G00159680 [Dallia pectoralis]|uniref:Uncharacterized protein n=1 Tax=Dallia pectoralis TaxID=75939 RepID=A0ACC2GG41_DALPE|nr:hypothetical protein DPEC_G00159680 [Dallia pectoralis]
MTRVDDGLLGFVVVSNLRPPVYLQTTNGCDWLNGGSTREEELLAARCGLTTEDSCRLTCANHQAPSALSKDSAETRICSLVSFPWVVTSPGCMDAEPDRLGFQVEIRRMNTKHRSVYRASLFRCSLPEAPFKLQYHVIDDVRSLV